MTGAVTSGGSVAIDPATNRLVFDPGTDFDSLDTGDTATVTVAYPANPPKNARGSGLLLSVS